jgi:hypothetical protein
VFVRSGTTWTQQQELTASDAAKSDFFGFAVAISGDTVVAGARRDGDAGPLSGSAYVFDLALNTPPSLNPSGGGVFELGPTSVVTLGGQVADADGDLLTYTWTEGATVLSGPDTIQAPANGDPIALPNVVINTQTLGVGVHTIELAVDDGVVEVTAEITVEVIAAEVPTLAPASSLGILWPPNGELTEVTIQANAQDNSGGPVTLSVEVTSNEPVSGPGAGNTEPDWLVVDVNSGTGLITLELRGERLGQGGDRVYTVTITAVDAAGNTSMATVTVAVAHDQRGN